MTDTIDLLGRSVSRVILSLIWVQAPVAVGTAILMGGDWVLVGVASLAVAAAPTLAWWR